MKKIFLSIALAALVGAGTVSTALACEGGKCTMAHTKDGKSKKGKKGTAGTEQCHMKSATAGKTPDSCCMKKDGAKADASKATKETKSQK
ncbi:hypothetical protein [Pontibacter vulgaris]|uniref:hypothetical protein n=1 Tax=Pontibacter vulgaris TaxID=2905679 RepID=UPI001FA705D6|nr:hypothetical protein [Pontibacter vulgaris]